MIYNADLEKELNELYPKGTRVRCIEMPDDPKPVPPGTLGTVTSVNGFGQIRVTWDNGSGLYLLYEIDSFEIVE